MYCKQETLSSWSIHATSAKTVCKSWRNVSFKSCINLINTRISKVKGMWKLSSSHLSSDNRIFTWASECNRRYTPPLWLGQAPTGRGRILSKRRSSWRNRHWSEVYPWQEGGNHSDGLRLILKVPQICVRTIGAHCGARTMMLRTWMVSTRSQVGEQRLEKAIAGTDQMTLLLSLQCEMADNRIWMIFASWDNRMSRTCAPSNRSTRRWRRSCWATK